MALLVLTALVFPAAAEQVSPHPQKVTLHLWGGTGWGVPPKDDTTPFGRSTRAVFEAFKKEHPEIELVTGSGLTIQGPPQSPASCSPWLVEPRRTSFYVNFRKLHTFIAQGFLLPLDEFVKKDPEILAAYIRRFAKYTVNGHLYCMPWFQCVMALHYRKDLFRDAGLDPNKPPRDWNEFYEYAKKLTDPEKGNGVLTFPCHRAPGYLTDFIWQAGGEVIARDKDGKYRAVFNDAGGVEALRFFKKLTRDPWTRNGKTYYGVASYR